MWKAVILRVITDTILPLWYKWCGLAKVCAYRSLVTNKQNVPHLQKLYKMHNWSQFHAKSIDNNSTSVI